MSHTISLNSDQSVVADIGDDGKVSLISLHKNQRNGNQLIANLAPLISVKQKGHKQELSINGTVYSTYDTKTHAINKIHTLTSFETKAFAQGKIKDHLPFERSKEKMKPLQTDLHTHFASALTPQTLIGIAVGKNVYFPKHIVDKLGLDTTNIQPNEQGAYLLDHLVRNQKNFEKLRNSMKIDASEQETFNRMEEIYVCRGPITKNPNMFVPMLEAIAEDAKANGVKYMELSLSSVISSREQLQLLDKHMPEIEKRTGVQLRFLGAMSRHSDKEWNDDEVDRLKVASKSPYVVGCDFMAHETNPTSDFAPHIKELAKHAMVNDPNFVIRVHAGENPLFKANVRQVFIAIEEAHQELLESTGKNFPYPQVRIGHGLYGFNEPPDRYEEGPCKDIPTIELAKRIDPVIEFNMSSNLSLNNINSIKDIPIKEYADAGIRMVLGTDGRGIYSTTIAQEMILAREAGLSKADFEKIRKTETEIMERAKQRFKQHSSYNLYEICDALNPDNHMIYKNGAPHYNAKVEEKYRNSVAAAREMLRTQIAHSGAETDPQAIAQAIADKKPIMLTGSSKGHWGKVSDENKSKIIASLAVLMRSINPDKAYLMTGGTNFGVEKEAHQIAHEFNKQSAKKVVVLGTFTEEAIQDKESIEKNTITHAIIPTQDGRPTKRWFDLQDAVLSMVEKQEGQIVAIAGGSIVSDIIQRAHNAGMNIAVMEGVEGASGEKAEFLAGNGYEFATGAELVMTIKKQNPELIQDIPEKELHEMYEEALKLYQESSKQKVGSSPIVFKKVEPEHQMQPESEKNISLDSSKTHENQ